MGRGITVICKVVMIVRGVMDDTFCIKGQMRNRKQEKNKTEKAHKYDESNAPPSQRRFSRLLFSFPNSSISPTIITPYPYNRIPSQQLSLSSN